MYHLPCPCYYNSPSWSKLISATHRQQITSRPSLASKLTIRKRFQLQPQIRIKCKVATQSVKPKRAGPIGLRRSIRCIRRCCIWVPFRRRLQQAAQARWSRVVLPHQSFRFLLKFLQNDAITEARSICVSGFREMPLNCFCELEEVVIGEWRPQAGQSAASPLYQPYIDD